jgi:hypothetical protein
MTSSLTMTKTTAHAWKQVKPTMPYNISRLLLMMPHARLPMIQ